MSLNEIEILRGATDERHVAAAIRVGLYKRYVSRGNSSTLAGFAQFAIGNDISSRVLRDIMLCPLRGWPND